MTFINEFTPPEDIEKYGLKQIDKRFEFLGSTSARDWTIDREPVKELQAKGYNVEVRGVATHRQERKYDQAVYQHP